MELPIEADNKLVAKFGEEYSEDDDLITVPENEGILDVAWFIYEFIELVIPIKHVHAPGKCNPAMMKMLDEVKWEMIEEWSKTKKAPKHAAWMHDGSYSE